jgi:hypothetical protein
MHGVSTQIHDLGAWEVGQARGIARTRFRKLPEPIEATGSKGYGHMANIVRSKEKTAQIHPKTACTGIKCPGNVREMSGKCPGENRTK